MAAFGAKVRERRKALSLSQEALAADALSNGDRKGYISQVENGRLSRITPDTARRISEAVGLDLAEVPASLRWRAIPGEADGAGRQIRISDTDLSALLSLAEEARRLRSAARMVDRLLDDVRRRMAVTPTESYRARLAVGLDRLERICGPAFGVRSLGISLTLAYLYVFFGGLLAYGLQGGSVGNLAVFDRPAWAAGGANTLLAVGATLVTGGAAACAFSWARARDTDGVWLPGRHSLSWSRSFGLRLIAAGILLGVATFLASLVGADAIAAATVMAIAAFGALSALGAKRAAWAGAAGGILAGSVEGLFNDNIVLGLIEGSIFGLVVGGFSGYFSGRIGERAPTPAIGSLAGSGTGVVVGAFATVCCYLALGALAPDGIMGSAMADGTFDILVVIWLVLPLVNAVTDFVSLGVSLRLGRAALAHTGDLRMLLGIFLLDLLVAMALLSATLGLVFIGLVTADAMLPLDLAPRSFLADSLADPFGAGIWLTVMILSTLLWTALHYVLVALPSVAAHLASFAVHARVQDWVTRDATPEALTFRTYLLSHSPALAFVAIYVALLLLSVVGFVALGTTVIGHVATV